MSRYIDADTMQEKAFQMNFQGRINERELFLFNRALSEMPTVDAVQVVRCRECKHHEVCKNGVNGWCNEHERPTDVTYFCADGERKEQSDG